MMSSSDAIIWNIEKDPHLRSTVMSVWLLDSEPTAARMATNLDRMVAAIPRLRQQVVPGRPRPMWDLVDDADFDLSEHYVTETMKPGASFCDALDFAEGWVREPFDRQRPLWRLALLTGLDDGKAAIIIKVHHAIADGMGMVLMLGAFTDFERTPATTPAVDLVTEQPEEREVFSQVERFATKVRATASAFAHGPVGTAVRFGRTLASAVRLVTPHRTPHSQLMTRRSAKFSMATRSIDLDRFKGVANASGCSMNDLFVSLVGDALVAHHAEQGVDCPRLRVHMPVNIRNDRTANLAGNQFVPARVSLDLRAESSEMRRSFIARQLESLRNEPALGHINTVSAAIQRLGKPISRWIIGGMMKGVDLLASNVPGPPFPLYLAGGRIEEFYAFGPPAGAALNATMFSYDGSVSIGMAIDDKAIVDRDAFLRCLDTTLDAAFPAGSAKSTKLRSAS